MERSLNTAMLVSNKVSSYLHTQDQHQSSKMKPEFLWIYNFMIPTLDCLVEYDVIENFVTFVMISSECMV